MTSHLAKGTQPIFNHLARRQFAAAAVATKGANAVAIPEVKISALENGVSVASMDTGSAVATMGIVVKAGSRFETYDTLGSSMALKAFAGLGGKNHSAIQINRTFEQLGARLNVTQDREAITYSATFLKDKADDAAIMLLEAATNQAFKPWELMDNTYVVQELLDNVKPCEAAMDLVHQAAFREGLGNSLYSPQYMVGKHKAPLLQAFFNSNFTSHRTAIVGLGVNHNVLASAANSVALEKGQGLANKTKYYGGELRCNRGGKKTYVCLAGEGAGKNDEKSLVAAKLLSIILGQGGSRIPYDANGSRIDKALGEGMTGVSAQGFCNYYSDGGLVGVAIQADAAQANKAVNAVAGALRNLSVNDAEVAAAKRALALEIADNVSDSSYVASNLGLKAINEGAKAADSVRNSGDTIASVTVGDVQATAKKLSSGKLSMSAVGNLSGVPYLDSL